MTTTTLPDSDEGINAVAELARRGQNVEIKDLQTDGLGAGLPPTVPVLVRPGQRPEAIRDVIEAYRLAPERRRGTAKVATLRAFIDLVNRHKSADSSAIFAATSLPSPSLTAVIDYHATDGTPGRFEHKIAYPFPITPELKAWIDANGKPFDQAAFAAFLEEHAAELTEPSGEERDAYGALFKATFASPNELIDLSRSLEIHAASKVRQGVRLASGERQIEFVEEHMTAKGEPVTIPGLFMVGLRPFVDGGPVRIVARLRYRLHNGAISWAFHLYRADQELRAAVQGAVLDVENETGLPCYEGAPES